MIHAKNRELPADKGHRTQENLEKTKELYPNIYEQIKDMDISIRYGLNRTEKTNEIIEGHYSLVMGEKLKMLLSVGKRDNILPL